MSEKVVAGHPDLAMSRCLWRLVKGPLRHAVRGLVPVHRQPIVVKRRRLRLRLRKDDTRTRRAARRKGPAP